MKEMGIKMVNGFVGTNYVEFIYFNSGVMQLRYSDAEGILKSKAWRSKDLSYILEKLVLVTNEFEVERIYVSDSIPVVNAIRVSDGISSFMIENDLECRYNFIVYEGRKILYMGDYAESVVFFVETLIKYFAMIKFDGEEV